MVVTWSPYQDVKCDLNPQKAREGPVRGTESVFFSFQMLAVAPPSALAHFLVQFGDCLLVTWAQAETVAPLKRAGVWTAALACQRGACGLRSSRLTNSSASETILPQFLSSQGASYGRCARTCVYFKDLRLLSLCDQSTTVSADLHISSSFGVSGEHVTVWNRSSPPSRGAHIWPQTSQPMPQLLHFYTRIVKPFSEKTRARSGSCGAQGGGSARQKRWWSLMCSSQPSSQETVTSGADNHIKWVRSALPSNAAAAAAGWWRR